MASAGKVLILVENLSVPFDRRVWQEATTLARNGYQVSVICPRMVDRRPFETIENVAIYRYPLPYTARRALGYFIEYPWAITLTFFYALYVFFRRGFRVIHACNPPDLFFLVALPFKMFGVKFLFDQHDLCPETFESKFVGKKGILLQVLHVLERCTYRTAEVVIATNESYKSVAIERGRKPAERVFVVRSAPDLSRFVPTQPDPALKKGKSFLVTYLGTMGQQDGLDYLLRSVRHIVHDRKRNDIQFTFMGGGENLTALKELAVELGVSEAVEFTGRVSNEQVLKTLSTADVCVAPDPISPLNDRSTMNKILEYMAMARPIVSYRLTESAFSAGAAAVYAVDNDEEDFARKIIELLSDPDRRARMGALGFSRLKSELSWEYSTRQLLKAYECALDVSGRPGD
ncbi:glycosyltransferase family 4 protein [bacterium]|nr:glycosyltransferase family 4 protein [bacterium]MBU1984284.1 glycosyltransferase family 4 protein [bacterium]